MDPWRDLEDAEYKVAKLERQVEVLEEAIDAALTELFNGRYEDGVRPVAVRAMNHLLRAVDRTLIAEPS